jgi:GTP-binding protein
MNKDRIINVAVIAHVDTGKSTLVDALLNQSGVFSAHEVHQDQVMDSNDLERERGITIYSKNCAIMHQQTKINIVDTPGHADFSSEVERIIKTVDTVILLVDASDGPMPQTRVVLKRALRNGLRPIVMINKIDKKDARPEEVINLCFDLFVELGATDEQLDFPILYGMAKQGIAKYTMDDDSKDLTPLFETLTKHVPEYPYTKEDGFVLQVSSLAYDDYVGRLGIGRIIQGTFKASSQYALARRDGTIKKLKVNQVFVNEGLKRVEVEEAYAGDIVIFSGISDLSIGETLSDVSLSKQLPMLDIEKPTLQMFFLVNDSPFVGRSGKLVTSRHLRARLFKELETNVGLIVEPLDDVEGFKVSGRGELHLSILLEQMRREGYELCVSKPEVLTEVIDGVLCEPFEEVIISAPDHLIGTVIAAINIRKGQMQHLHADMGYTTCTYLVPTRGLIGYRSEFMTSTKGTGTMEKSFHGYLPYAGVIEKTRNGVFIAKEPGKTMAYALWNLSERGVMIVPPATDVYAGMVVGINSRDNDLIVNPCKNKQLTNMRASGSDEAIRLSEPKTFTLEEALEFIEEDELVEITPDAIRIRKKILDEILRKRANKKYEEKE